MTAHNAPKGIMRKPLTGRYSNDTMLGMICKDCRRQVVARGYCDTHYRQHKRIGDLPPSSQARRQAVIENDIAKIPLGVDAKHGYALVDRRSADKFDKYLWTVSNGYAVRNDKNNKHIFMHQEIIGKAPSGLVIDHRNNNKLDNRKSNLRFITQQQNMFNTNAIGITWRKDRRKWMARIKVNGKSIFLGNYINREDAEKARKAAKGKYHVI